MSPLFYKSNIYSKPIPLTSDGPTILPTKNIIAHPDRWLTVGLYPEFRPQTPTIRLKGKWLKAAGFMPNSRVRVRVMRGCLVITLNRGHSDCISGASHDDGALRLAASHG